MVKAPHGRRILVERLFVRLELVVGGRERGIEGGSAELGVLKEDNLLQFLAKALGVHCTARERATRRWVGCEEKVRERERDGDRDGERIWWQAYKCL